MKISRTGSLSSSPIRRTGRSPAGTASGFAQHLPATGEAPETLEAHTVSGTRTASAVDALLSVQEMGDALEQESQARERAAHILDSLDELRHGLLSGQMSRHQIENLARLVRHQRGQVRDPRLLEVLDQIELRAEIELAKYSTLD